MSEDITPETPQTTPTAVIEHPHRAWMSAQIEEIIEEKFKGGSGGGGNMSDLERRVANLETDLKSVRDSVTSLTTDVAVMKSNYATKLDTTDLKSEIASLKSEMHKEFRDIHKEFKTLLFWIIGTLIALAGILRYLPPSLPNQLAPAPVQIEHPTVTK